MSILWIVFAVLMSIVGACDVMSLVYERDTLWKYMPKDTWWLTLICKVLFVCAAAALVIVKMGGTL